MKSFAVGILRAGCGSVADIVNGYFEERSTSFEYLPNLVDDAVGFGDCSPFCIVAL